MIQNAVVPTFNRSVDESSRLNPLPWSATNGSTFHGSRVKAIAQDADVKEDPAPDLNAEILAWASF